MEFFGLSFYGFTDPIKDMMREDYQEPRKPSGSLDDKRDKRKFFEKMKELDCYLGPADGYAYGSYERLTRMRKKKLWKPVGPMDMYQYPGVNSMKPGWWHNDPVLLQLKPEDNWFKPKNAHGITTSEMSRFINYCLTIDKYFKM